MPSSTRTKARSRSRSGTIPQHEVDAEINPTTAFEFNISDDGGKDQMFFDVYGEELRAVCAAFLKTVELVIGGGLVEGRSLTS